MTNTTLLREKINESGYKLRFIAKQLGISYQCLMQKVNNDTEFKASEICKLCSFLNIDISQKEEIFFNN